jgi:hypothetical protein
MKGNSTISINISNEYALDIPISPVEFIPAHIFAKEQNCRLFVEAFLVIAKG